MEFNGRILRVLPVRSGTSQRGEWKALPFVFEYFENGEQRWSDKVLLETFDTNVIAQIGNYLKKGQNKKAVVENGEYVLIAECKCKCGFSHTVRSFDRQDGTRATVNEIRLYKFEVIPAAEAPQLPQQAQNPFQPQQPQVPFPSAGGESDDLPF